MTVQNDIKKWLPERLKRSKGKNLPGIYKTLNESFERLEQLVQACIDQLFLQTASGRFLIQLGEQEGFVMPSNSGLDIRSYKTLVPIMVSNPKQVRSTFQELIEGFYGRDKTRPSIIASNPSPYSIQPGDDIIIETELGISVFSITADQVSDFSNVTAAEIAAVINSTQNNIFADQITNRSNNLEYMRLSSNSSGPAAFVRVAGGKLQNILKFPKVIGTQNSSSTTWNLSKTSPYSDLLTFTWDGLGTNPNIFLSKKGDVITIRELVDGVEQFSLLNGSYEAVDVGYDYFVIRNTMFSAVSATLTQPADESIVFTKNQKITIYENSEYALISETKQNTVTISVPAVPPLARRFLQGSAHLQGLTSEVVDFTRNTIKVNMPLGADRPEAVNNILFFNKYFRLNFRNQYYNTIAVDNSLDQPTYTVDSSDDTSAVLPYTVSTLLGSDPFYGEVGSEEITVDFPFRHGLSVRWGMTLAGCVGGANILNADLNKEHQISRVLKNNKVAIRIGDGSGGYKKFEGFSFGPADVYQHATDQANGSDFYLQFASPAAALASGIEVGSKFNFDPLSGTDIDSFIAQKLKYRFLNAVEISGDKIHFSAGIGIGSGGLIIDDVTGKRSGYFGGATVSHFFDKLSSNNQEYVFSDLKALFIGYTKSSNPEYVGSFIYDPDGEKTTVTVSKYIVKLTDGILRGDNVPYLQVDSTSVGDDEMPQSGEIILDYGKDNFEGPIRYYAVISSPGANQILIDPAYRFKKTHTTGAAVQRIHSSTPFKPDQTGESLPAYLTGTSSARNTLFALAEILTAAGVFIEQDVNLPDLRYSDGSISVFA